MTDREAASYLKMSRSYMAHLRLSGAGPEYLKLNRAVRYSRDALDRWLASRTRRHTGEA
jgi:predicted DNA-binding transcriptional regulator AlpA